MRILENIRMALEGLRANKMRSILTMLGIIIGIAAVIGILTVGDGLSGFITSKMTSFGASTIAVTLQEHSDSPSASPMIGMRGASGPEQSDYVSPEMIDTLLERYGTLIDAVSLTESVGPGRVEDGHLYANVSVSGVNEGAFTVNDLNLLHGRLLRESDIEGERNVCIVSDKLVHNLFHDDVQSALGAQISVSTMQETLHFRIVGIYEYQQSAFSISSAADKDVSTALYIPVSTAKHIMGAPDGYFSFSLTAAVGADPAAVAATISNFLNRYYRNNENYRVLAISMQSMIQSVNEIMNTLSIAISVIAAISLLVGGIGVMNIMLVSVTERTREIGTRKALGATNNDIRVQFVVESIIICLIGGIIGILLGAVMGYVGSSLLGSASLPSFSGIAIAVGFSAAVGVFFGYYPANKAAKLDPIEALRYE